MARSGYTRSVYSAVTHLLSSFRNDEALRRNPLVSRHFDVGDVAEAAERVRALIRDGIESIVQTAPPQLAAIAKRKRQILLRYDLDGATRNEVCDELGVTERQLYRDRRAASEMLAAYLRAALPEAPESYAVTAQILDPAELALHAAIRMSAAGALTASRERALAVSSFAGDMRWRIVATALDAHLRIARGEFCESAQLVAVAEQLVEQKSRSIGAARAQALRALFNTMRARIAWGQGDEKEASRFGRMGIDRFVLGEPQALTGPDPVSHMLLRNMICTASLLTDIGETGAADSLLGDLQRSIDRIPNGDYLELERRSVLSRFQTINAADSTAIARDIVETMTRAQKLGMPIVASEAAMFASWFAARSGDSRAKEFQEAALAFSGSHDSTTSRSSIQAWAAIIELRIGTPQRALDLAQAAMGGYPRDSTGHAYCTSTLARAQLSCGLIGEAFESAQSVAGSNATRERAGALLVMARASAALGEPKRALGYVDDAIDLLGRFGNTYVLRDARALRNKVA